MSSSQSPAIASDRKSGVAIEEMSKRRGWKAEQRRPESSGHGTRLSAKTLEKVNVIKNSAWRHAREDSSSSEGEEEEKRQSTTIYIDQYYNL